MGREGAVKRGGCGLRSLLGSCDGRSGAAGCRGERMFGPGAQGGACGRGEWTHAGEGAEMVDVVWMGARRVGRGRSGMQ